MKEGKAQLSQLLSQTKATQKALRETIAKVVRLMKSIPLSVSLYPSRLNLHALNHTVILWLI